MIGDIIIWKTYVIKFVVFLASTKFWAFLVGKKIVQLKLLAPTFRGLSLAGDLRPWPKLPRPKGGFACYLVGYDT